jgi:hypothetical protein
MGLECGIMAKNVRLAMIGTALFLPGAIVFFSLVLGIEPTFAPIAPRGPGSPHLIQSLLVLGWIVVLPAIAFVLNLMPLVQARRAGKAILAQPMNLAVSMFALGIVSAFFGAIIIDQYPCWLGVPNCD